MTSLFFFFSSAFTRLTTVIHKTDRNPTGTNGDVYRFTLDALEIGLLWRESMYFKESIFHTRDPTELETVYAYAEGKRCERKTRVNSTFNNFSLILVLPCFTDEIPTYQSSAIEMIRLIENTKLKIKLAFRGWSVRNEQKIRGNFVATRFITGQFNLAVGWTSYLLQKGT